MKKIITIFCLFIASLLQAQSSLPWLKVSTNQRFFQTQNGKPFFWLGDTGWLLFVKCSREEVLQYLDARQQQGFNVVQAMVLHTLAAKNVYGDDALDNKDVSKPLTTPGSNFNNEAEYDFWDHVDFVIKEAAKRGIYMALVPVWGSNVKEGGVSVKQASVYGKFLASRYKNQSNIIWLNGGDINGEDGMDVWQTLGKTIKKYDAKHLMTYHPRGRYTSSDWFHNERWLDFNMFQSGHKRYEQDTAQKEKHRFGEDNWRFVNIDYNLKPVKPTLDGEPSYENIPHGLHDSLEKRWQPQDIRRYAYWSVFAGAAGFTYGENAVMQFNKMGDADANFGVFNNWKETLDAPGALQMKHLKNLMLSYSYFDRKPAQQILQDNVETKYNYLLATKGSNYAMVYTYTGRDFTVNLSRLGFPTSKAKWYSPATGEYTSIVLSKNEGAVRFNPPGEQANGNDWVLILEK